MTVWVALRDDAPTSTPRPTVSPSLVADAACPLSGRQPPAGDVVTRPALGVKVENDPAAYPLEGLMDAEVVIESLIEAGSTRFLALYHCTDSTLVGPVRSARALDPDLLAPFTRILAFSGANSRVLGRLRAASIIAIDENTTRGMRRVLRAGASAEHTLFADTRPLRNYGEKFFALPPPQGVLSFGDLPVSAAPASKALLEFSSRVNVSYSWTGEGWRRMQDGQQILTDPAEGSTVDNVLIEVHHFEYAKGLTDASGVHSVKMTDVVGSGPVVLLRDGHAIYGRWTRAGKDEAARYVTEDGLPITLRPGTTWIELVPDDRGRIRGSYVITQ